MFIFNGLQRHGGFAIPCVSGSLPFCLFPHDPGKSRQDPIAAGHLRPLVPGRQAENFPREGVLGGVPGPRRCADTRNRSDIFFERLTSWGFLKTHIKEYKYVMIIMRDIL